MTFNCFKGGFQKSSICAQYWAVILLSIFRYFSTYKTRTLHQLKHLNPSLLSALGNQDSPSKFIILTILSTLYTWNMVLFFWVLAYPT